MNRLLLGVAGLSLLTGAVVLNQMNSSEQTSVYQPRINAEQANLNGHIEYLKMLRANPATGEVSMDEYMKAYFDVLKMKKNKSLGIQWEEMGPDDVGGRTRAFLIDKTNPNKFWAGSVGGGLYVSTNAGASWTPVSDLADNLAISSIAQLDNGRIFVGTGASFENPMGTGGSGSLGAGLYEVTGNSLTQIEGCSTIPCNIVSGDYSYINDLKALGNRLFVATGRGLRVFDFVNAPINPIELAPGIPLTVGCQSIDIHKDGTVIASFGSSVYVSSSGNFGTFNTKTTFSGASRTEVAIAPSNSSYIYASSTTGSNGGCLSAIRQSRDKGVTWTVLPHGPSGTGTDPFAQTTGGGCQGGYDNTIAVNPKNPGFILVGGIQLWKWVESSTKGVGQWTRAAVTAPDAPQNIFYVHADKHRIVWKDSSTVFVASDGGIGRSIDAGNTWSTMNYQYNVTQFYSVATNAIAWYGGGTQDNGSRITAPGLTNSTHKGSIEILGGDGFDFDFGNLTGIAFATLYFGAINRIESGGSGGSIWDAELDALCGGGSCAPFHTVIRYWESFNNPNSKDSVDIIASQNYAPGSQITYPCAHTDSITFTATLPSGASQGDTLRLPDYAQSRLAFNTTSGGSKIWLLRSAGNLQLNPEWDLIGDNTNGFSGTAECMEFSEDGNHLFVGTSNGVVYRFSGLNNAYDSSTTDIRSSMTAVTLTNIGSFGRVVTGIAVDPNNANNIIITLGNYGSSAYVYRSINAATTVSSSGNFTLIQGGGTTRLPNMPVYDAVIDQTDKNKVLLATEWGVFSTNQAFSSASPQWFDESFAHVPSFEIRQQTLSWKHAWNPQEIVVGTHGRGIWRTSSLVSVKDNTQTNISNSLVSEIKVYPNPMINNGTIALNLVNQSNKGVIKVYNINGSVVKTIETGFLTKGNHKFNIDANQFPTGSYIIVFEGETEKAYAKFVKAN